MKIDEILTLEAKRSFDYFWHEANTDPTSRGYGLIRDNNAPASSEMASIASVGFGLSGIVIAIERGWISHEAGAERTLGTLKTFWENAAHSEGFFYHFLNMTTADKYEAYYDCASIIDTSLFLNGAITAAEYFGGEIAALTDKIYRRVNWQVYYNQETNQYYMGYRPESGGFGAWDTYAEQLMQYILGVGSPTHSVPAKIYEGFDRTPVEYGPYRFVNAPGGALFVHQFSHAWFDFSQVRDGDGMDWFENSVKATLAQRQYGIEMATKSRSFHENSWGLTAAQGPNGYHAFGAPPFTGDVGDKSFETTIAPCASIGSLVFAPTEVKAAVDYFYTIPDLFQQYGFQDAFDFEAGEPWIAERVIGIDKGISLLMIDNYQSGTIWKLYMQNKYVKAGVEKLNWKTKEG